MVVAVPGGTRSAPRLQDVLGSQCGDDREDKDRRTEPPSSRSWPQVLAKDGARIPAEDRRGLRCKGKHWSEDAVCIITDRHGNSD